MAALTLRNTKGTPLTNTELDANFTNLNTDKAELANPVFTGSLTAPNLDSLNITTNNYPISRPSLLLDFTNNNTLDPRITFTRASTATAPNNLGVLTTFAANTPRFAYDASTLEPKALLIEEQRTNLLGYSNYLNLTSIYATQNGYITNQAGIAPNGTNSASLLTQGGTGANYAYIGTTSSVTYTSGVTYTFSGYFKAGTYDKVYILLYGTVFNNAGSNITAWFNLTTGTVGGTVGAANPTITAEGNGWYRCSISKDATTTITTTAALQIARLYDTAVSGSSIYVWGLQCEAAGSPPSSYIPSATTFTSRASTGSYFDATGTLQLAAINVARNTYNPANLVAAPFLLLEEARTNSIRNSTMVGAIAGSPGTQPTGWVGWTNTISGVTGSIVGLGVENGINYIDWNVQGTFTGTTGLWNGPTFTNINVVSAVYGQTWTESVYLKLQAGALGDASLFLRLLNYTSGNASITSFNSAINVTSAALATQRLSHTWTPSSDTTAYITPGLRIALVNGSTYNFTIRIGLPQLENNSISTGVTSATVASGGSGYTNGNTLTVVGGTGTATTLTVTGVSAGVITSVSVATAGNYSVFPTGPVSVTGGTGTLATFNIVPVAQAGSATSVIPNSPTFTSRASAATYYNSAGLLTSAATNVARYNYNPANLTQPANLILEAAATNLLTYSSEFDNAAWTKARVLVALNVTTSPDGNMNADKLIEDTTATTNNHVIYQFYSATSTTLTLTIYAKAAERTHVRLEISNFLNDAAGATINLLTGTVLISGSSGIDYTNVSATATAIGNGWYRCSLTATKGTVNSTNQSVIFVLNGTTADYVGDGVSGIYIYGAQLETGTVATTYVPSTNTFTSRASTGTYFDSAGVLQSAAINVARNTYNPANLSAAPFLLLEEQRTNLLTYSSEFDNAAWVKTDATVSTNSILSPDGNINADTVTNDSTTAFHQIEQAVTGVLSTQYAISVYAKAGTHPRCRLAGRSSSNWVTFPNGIFDLTTGLVVTSTGDKTATIEAAGNGWYRCTIYGTCTTSTNIGAVAGPVPTGLTTNNFNGTTYPGNIYLWGAQLEAGAYPTSYIPTTTTALTRSADVSSSATTTRAADVSSQTALTRAADVSSSAQTTRAADNSNISNLSSWYNSNEGTFYAEFVVNASPATGNYGSIWNLNYYPNDISLTINPGPGGTFGLFARNSAVTQADLTSLVTTLGATNKFAITLKNNDFAQSYNGGTVTTDTSGTLPSVTTNLGLGSNYSNSTKGLLYLKRIAYYPRRLSNTELQALTS